MDPEAGVSYLAQNSRTAGPEVDPICNLLKIFRLLQRFTEAFEMLLDIHILQVSLWVPHWVQEATRAMAYRTKVE